MDGDLEHHLQQNYLRITDEGKIRWHDGSPDHPRNWSASNKAYGMVLIIFLDFFTYVYRYSHTSRQNVRVNGLKIHSELLSAQLGYCNLL